MPSIWNVNRETAYAYEARPDYKVACISISQPGEPNFIHESVFAVLRLEFEDVDPDRGHFQSTHSRSFTAAQARLIKAFADMIRGANIMVHCDAGISRSAAVVEALLEYMPEYIDAGGTRHPNNWVKRCLKRALGLAPIGA